VLLAGPPPSDIVLPEPVVRVAAGRPVRPVWLNQLGGLTVEVGEGPGRCFVKWAPAGSDLDLAAEAERMAWVAPWAPVPRVLDLGTADGPEPGTWLVTAALPGQSAVSDRWRREPAIAAAAIGEGLRHLHEQAPVADCPFTWSNEDRITVAHRRAEAGLIDPAAWKGDHGGRTVEEALATLADPPPIDRLVVCHGDACAPNTLIDDQGRFAGLVDLGSLGAADRWADLAVATWSLEWNHGPGWDATLLAAYGMAPDLERAAWYRLLWDLA
jgi:aminoglycoside phosphotransferase